jgi:hypothetical protein
MKKNYGKEEKKNIIKKKEIISRQKEKEIEFGSLHPNCYISVTKLSEQILFIDKDISTLFSTLSSECIIA